jgi:hypothetical protein
MQVDVESGAIMSREAAVKKIAVKSLTDKTNVPLLAGEIVEKCKLIHPSKASSGDQRANCMGVNNLRLVTLQ